MSFCKCCLRCTGRWAANQQGGLQPSLPPAGGSALHGESSAMGTTGGSALHGESSAMGTPSGAKGQGGPDHGLVLAEARGKRSREEIAHDLAHQGFTLKQLLLFYKTYADKGMIKKGTTTNDVVKNIIIPETAGMACCYMKSAFMMNRDTFGDDCGGHRATRLVSHAWKSEFVNTVLNIVNDATGWDLKMLREVGRNKGLKVYEDGVLQVTELMELMEVTTLCTTYWLCIFAVDEHHAICGDCWSCNKKQEWLLNPGKHLTANPCMICGSQKFNPCNCGSLKYRPGDGFYEIDTFDLCVAKMEKLVVSLDQEMASIRRVWVVAEIGTALMMNLQVSFRLAMALGAASMQTLCDEGDLLDTVANCQATSEEDRSRIMHEIEQLAGGIPAYDSFVNAMIEMSFGVCRRVDTLGTLGLSVIERMTHVNMKFGWASRFLTDVSKFKIAKGFAKMTNAQHVDLDFSSCSSLQDIGELGKGLGNMTEAQHVQLNFRYCSSLQDIGELGKGLGKMTNAQHVELNFRSCSSLQDISELGKGLANMTNAQHVELDFRSCSSLQDISELSTGLESMRNSRYLNLLCD